MNTKRTQLTLFVPESDAETIEQTRKGYNSAQYELIKSHVTICREDELEFIEKVINNLEKMYQCSTIINFGDIVRFNNGKGLMLPATGNNEPFANLRKAILEGVIEPPRKYEPHITLMHPRNSTCTNDIFTQIKSKTFPSKILFNKISLIQQEMGMPCEILREFELKSPANFLSNQQKQTDCMAGGHLERG